MRRLPSSTPEEGQQQQEEEEEEEEDLSTLHPRALLYRSAGRPNFLVMADALAHGADVNWLNAASDSRSPLLQAVTAVRGGPCPHRWDATYQDIFRDFSHSASNNPEKLKRRIADPKS
ncbi:unnamed protein product [Arctogadus glacialis]